MMDVWLQAESIATEGWLKQEVNELYLLLEIELDWNIEVLNNDGNSSAFGYR